MTSQRVTSGSGIQPAKPLSGPTRRSERRLRENAQQQSVTAARFGNREGAIVAESGRKRQVLQRDLHVSDSCQPTVATFE